MPFIAAYFYELVSSSTLTPPSCHSARRVYPELQNPLFQKAKENFLPGEKVPFRADEGLEKDLPFRSVWLRDDLFMMEP